MGIAIGAKHVSVVWRVSVSRRVRYGRFHCSWEIDAYLWYIYEYFVITDHSVNNAYMQSYIKSVLGRVRNCVGDLSPAFVLVTSAYTVTAGPHLYLSVFLS